MVRLLGRFVLGVVLLASACQDPPTTSSVRFEWSPSFAELPAAVLSVCGSNDAVFAVGGEGDEALALRWSSNGWQQEAVPASASILWWCWSSPAGDVIAVGDAGTIVRRDPSGEWSAFAPISPTTLYGVWGTDASNVWAVGGSATLLEAPATILHFDGTSWTAVDVTDLPQRGLFKIWGSSASDVWAVGIDGVILHFDGEEWTQVSSPVTVALISVWGASATEVFAVGGRSTGTVLRYDGSAWSLFAEAPEGLSGVWTAPDGPLVVGGNRGYTARFSRTGGRLSSESQVAMAAANVDVHAILGLGNEVYLAAASDLLGGGAGRWRGSVFTTSPSFEGPLELSPKPDGGIADAGIVDAGPQPDAEPGFGPGERCEADVFGCRSDLTCLGLAADEILVCTEECESVDDCTDYGPGACCAIPGPQLVFTYCIPGESLICQ